jgi:hypothetical protein
MACLWFYAVINTTLRSRMTLLPVSGNSSAGRIQTLLSEEKEVCCGMGKEGLCCCLALCPFAIYSPTGGLGAFCLVTNYLRRRTMEKYGVEEQDVCNCSDPSANACCNFCCYGFNYPCSLFQMAVSIEYWEAEENLPLGDQKYMTNMTH